MAHCEAGSHSGVGIAELKGLGLDGNTHLAAMATDDDDRHHHGKAGGADAESRSQATSHLSADSSISSEPADQSPGTSIASMIDAKPSASTGALAACGEQASSDVQRSSDGQTSFSRGRKAAVLMTGWLAMFGLYSNLLMFGILYVQLLEEFQAGKGVTAWIGSLMYGVMLFSSRLAAVLCKRWGASLVMMCGALLCPMALLFSSIVTDSVYWLFLTYGLMLGVGTGLVFHTVTFFVARYFPEQIRARVMSITLMGGSVGVLSLSPAYEAVISRWGWRRALWWLAAIQAVCAYCPAVVFLPLQATGKPEDSPVNNAKTDAASDTGHSAARSHTHAIESSEAEGNHSTLNGDSMQAPEMSSPARCWKSSALTLLGDFVDAVLLPRQLWRNAPFLLLTAASVLFIICYSTPVVHIVNMVESEKNISSQNAALLLTTMAASGLVQLSIFGLVCDWLSSTRSRLRLLSLMVLGLSLANMLVPFGYEYWHFVVYATVIGVGRSAILVMIVLSKDLTSAELFNTAWASMTIINAMPDLIGPPVMGWITDAVGSYRLAYILAGCTALSGIILIELAARLLPASHSSKHPIRMNAARDSSDLDVTVELGSQETDMIDGRDVEKKRMARPKAASALGAAFPWSPCDIDYTMY